MSKRRAILLVCSASLMLVFAVWAVWSAYQPKVGPIGNGPDYRRVWFQFGLHLISAGCFLTLGIHGLYTHWKKNKEEHGETKEE
ncbi:hypothetical protein KDJ56_19480 [Brevibacillus composti]|uniref:DUF4405 domain-containing protein n=1 Tax=Brevibacillus composti TaxID=2796470 RepID=A0A7T5EJZ9_9BACL|nr:hypothetical protein [Brevibacillus composti]QQE74019.1 hypothetical protein JD108_19545 [Brevibacillus composti]QUO41103.1 hypothetical protein KDJ56_19480 [Brevibacillus composti]